MRTTWIVALLIACSEPAPRGVPPPQGAVESTAEPLGTIRQRSGCAFATPEALCESFREQHLSSGTGWVSDGCAPGERRVSNGAFAEVRVLGIRVGHNRADGARVERRLLSGSVREPPGAEATTELVIAARVGRAWFPIHTFHPPMQGEIPGRRVEWVLDPSGDTLTWTDEEGASVRDDPYGSGATERTIAAVHRGVPRIAARATLERWRSDVDLPCARACNAGSRNAPSPPDCSRRCATRIRETRTWERVGETIRIGATQVRREGHAPEQSEVHVEEAEVRRLDDADEWMDFCAFMPVVRAIAASPPAAAQSRAAERARAILRSGTFRVLGGASAAAVPDGPRAIVEIYEQGGGACGGGACTTAVGLRTIEGPMPERGVAYFANERGNQVGCSDATLPEGGESTFVEVAPAISREAIGCGFTGYDGTTRRYWVILRVFERAD